METRHVEVERFAKKAGSYKKALQLAPHARDMELRAVVAMVNGICRTRGWQPAEVQVVDLMAGSGVLSGALRAAGFRRIKAVEACAEMLPDGEAGIEFVNGDTFANIRAALQDIRPHIVVSLAGFHHLIERRGKNIDRTRSIVAQATLAGACFDALVPGGVLVVVDIAEGDDFERLDIAPIREWEGSAFREMESVGQSAVGELAKTKSLKQYEEVVVRHFGAGDCDGTLKWFREFVDPMTVVGHDDVAISSELLEILKWKYGNRVRFARFRCPWVFRDSGQAIDFVLQKFGFYVDRSAKEVQREEVEAGLRKYLAFADGEDGRPCTLAWSLGAWVLQAPEDGGGTSQRATLTVLLLCLSAIMFIRTVIRIVVGEGAEVDTVLSGGAWLVFGMFAGMLVDDLKKRLS